MKVKLYLLLYFFLQCSKPFPDGDPFVLYSTLFSIQPDPTKYLFVTIGTYNGNLGGITGADAICSTEKSTNYSTLPGAGSEYRAVLSDGSTRIACTTADCTNPTENVNWVLQASTPYYLPNGTLLFTTNTAGILPSATPLNVALGTGADSWWTGLSGDWTSLQRCVGWTSLNGGDTGNNGIGGVTNSTWIGDLFNVPNSNFCNSNLKILCAR